MEERLQLLAIAERHKAWILEDDYDGEYRFRGQPVPALRGLDGADRVIYVGTFGKTLFPSLRLGFLVVPRQLAERVRSRAQRLRAIRAAAPASHGRRLHQ